MAGPGNILIKIGAEAGQALSELSSVNKSLGSTMTASEKMGAGIRKAALPAAAALATIGYASIDAAKAAAEDAAAKDKLVGALERTTGATKAQAEATDDWIGKLSLASGVADDKLRPAMQRLAASTGDVHKAQEALETAMDISAATGKDVVGVANALGKAYDGSTGSLKKLGLGIDDATLKSKDMSKIMAEIGDKTGGAMAAQAETATGQYAIFTNQMDELKESLGAGLLPIVQELLPVLNKFGQFAAEHTGTVKVLTGIIAGLAGGILALNGVLKAYAAVQGVVKAATAVWTGAQILLNAALAANPIGLIILALVALGGALVVAYKKSETFRDIVNGALNAVKAVVQHLAGAFTALLNAARAAFDWIVDHWRVALFAFGPIGAAIVAIVDNFNTLKSVAVNVFNAIKGAVEGIAGAIASVVGAVKDLIGWLGRIHVPHIDLPGPFMVGGAPAPALAGMTPRSSGSITINVNGAIDPEGTARTIRRVLASHDRRLGRTTS